MDVNLLLGAGEFLPAQVILFKIRDLKENCPGKSRTVLKFY